MSKTPTGKYLIVAALAAMLCGLLHTLPRFGSLPGSNDLLAAARGIAAANAVQGVLPASVSDRIAGWLWQTGGADRLNMGLGILTFLDWTVAAFAVLFGAGWIARSFPKGRVPVIVVAGLGLVATCVPPAWSQLRGRQDLVADMRLLAPVDLADAVKALGKNELFANAGALPHLLLFAPQTAGDLNPENAAMLARKPPAWRDALRQSRWNTVLLSGPPQEYAPLLGHLLESPDWHLALVTNMGYLFRRGDGPAAAAIDPDKFKLATPTETAIYLSQVAEYYEAIRRPGDAHRCLEKALDLAPDNTGVLSRAASNAITRRRWQDAIALSDRALAQDPDFTHAKIAKALALAETHEPARAQQLLDQALAQSPDDIYTLFLYARVCRDQNDYLHEAETLERIIALSDRLRQPTVHYHIYLGQAYARQGRAKEAITNYQAALDSGMLTEREAAEIKEALETIKANQPKNG